MDDAGVVSGPDAGQQSQGDAVEVFGGQGAVLQDLSKRWTLDVVHDERWLPVVLQDLANGDDVFVVQSPLGLTLSQQPFPDFMVTLAQQFDGRFLPGRVV